ncbi:hypothetical protein HNR42_001106 [Deinobacterium chartae]|uniref:Deacetylase PdaC domain-containing protein n=1 Tax=Deinobacterium chartae TaxID=521158 RepID=A0A841HZR2_9DEIO|nr:DUF4163 domain-containing protein [Deinobacterium chartae]MBB6097689.1 hypothetical protein [Deinobacterium chartae]
MTPAAPTVLLLAALSLSPALAAPAAPWSGERVFRGSLEGVSRTLRLTLRLEANRASGSYVYEGIDKPLRLSGSLSGNALTLTETDASGRATGRFQLQAVAPGPDSPMMTLAGSWSRPDGSGRRTVSLEHQAVEGSGVRFRTQRIQEKTKNLNLDMAYPVFQVPPASLAKLNAYLEADRQRTLADLRQWTAEYLQQRSKNPDLPNVGSDLYADYTITLATRRALSLRLSGSSYSAGAAHPNNDSTCILFDLEAGKTVKLSELFRKGSAYAARLSQEGSRVLAQRLGGEAPGDATQVYDETQGCLTRQGLLVYYGLPHVISALDGILIPWSKLRDLVDPKGLAAGL